MPIYQRRCKECDHEWEEIRKIADCENTNPCPACGSGMVDRIIRPPHYTPFKEGWYEHIASDPIYCRNKKELREACQEHGKTSVYLEDM